MNVSDLVQWIITHERVWKNLPEEFKNQTEAHLWFDFVLFGLLVHVDRDQFSQFGMRPL